MRLTILGSSGSYAAAGNPASGFLIEEGGARLWLDAGTGTFAALQEIAEYTRLDALLLSHVHSDHCLDLYPLYYARRFHPEVHERLPVYAPPGAREVLGSFLAAQGDDKLDQVFDFREIGEGRTVEIAGVRFEFLRTVHPIHTLAVRASSATGVLTYSSDTGPGCDLAGFAHGSGVLVCEATYQEGRTGPPFHLTAHQAGETARQAGVREVVLTHLWPDLDPERSLAEARETAGEVEVRWARPGEALVVSGSIQPA